MVDALFGVVGGVFRQFLEFLVQSARGGRRIGPDDDDVEHMRAWSISAQLAAVPAAYLEQVPPEVAALIRAAKDLHPDMARGADKRAARGEA